MDDFHTIITRRSFWARRVDVGVEGCKIVFPGGTSYSFVHTLLLYDVSFSTLAAVHSVTDRRTNIHTHTYGQTNKTDDIIMLVADRTANYITIMIMSYLYIRSSTSAWDAPIGFFWVYSRLLHPESRRLCWLCFNMSLSCLVVLYYSSQGLRQF